MEIRVRLAREKKLKLGTSSISRFFSRNDNIVNKTLSISQQDCPDVAAARAQLKAEQPLLDTSRLVSSTRRASRQSK